ncbi:MAG: flavodoxin-dependent (E)-4-hydroxy-3-methylbut-2-enyl-diphosphate synthase [Firmicutes bacterium]|nr:flavodoxin-dependent (E)-4-hydroxy-3-methylbut-2-enyl-diphosphate synthase [Bacillota bacterium]
MGRTARPVRVGELVLGGGNPVRVQSMTKTDTRDVEATVGQIRRLEEAGCELVRVAVPDGEAAAVLGQIRRRMGVPLVADIHYDYRLALQALEQGVDKLRINPGNIGARWKVEEVARAARERGVPIRIGVNAGSLERDVERTYGRTARALVESALRQAEVLESVGFSDIVLSLKSSDVVTTVEAYRQAASRCPYPLHLGLTEAGTAWAGAIRSAVALGALLLEGIGDTLRVSLNADPVREVQAAWYILRAVGLRARGVELIACPTCGRCQVDLMAVASRVEEALAGVEAPLKVAVMGCVVNGPGEAREADVGLAAGRGRAVLFRRGEKVRTVPASRMVEELLAEVHRLLEDVRPPGAPPVTAEQPAGRPAGPEEGGSHGGKGIR